MVEHLHGRRERQRRNAEAAARGERLFSDSLSSRGISRLAYVFDEVAAMGPGGFDPWKAASLLHRDIGWKPIAPSSASDIVGLAEDDVLPSAIEACVRSVDDARMRRYVVSALSEILDEENYSFRWVADQIIPFEDDAVFVGTVEPAIRLVLGRSPLEGVETAFREALSEVRTKPGNAVTDAARALEEALIALDCDGTSLKTRLVSARKKGLFNRRYGRIEPMLGHVVSLVEAIRGGGDDAHAGERLTSADAWFVIHIVGACIVRWFDAEPIG